MATKTQDLSAWLMSNSSGQNRLHKLFSTRAASEEEKAVHSDRFNKVPAAALRHIADGHDVDGKSPLHYAIEHEYLEEVLPYITKESLKQRAMAGKDTPLHAVIYSEEPKKKLALLHNLITKEHLELTGITGDPIIQSIISNGLFESIGDIADTGLMHATVSKTKSKTFAEWSYPIERPNPLMLLALRGELQLAEEHILDEDVLELTNIVVSTSSMPVTLLKSRMKRAMWEGPEGLKTAQRIVGFKRAMEFVGIDVPRPIESIFGEDWQRANSSLKEIASETEIELF